MMQTPCLIGLPETPQNPQSPSRPRHAMAAEVRMYVLCTCTYAVLLDQREVSDPQQHRTECPASARLPTLGWVFIFTCLLYTNFCIGGSKSHKNAET